MQLQLKGNKQPGRNEPCPCTSGLKFKYCHGDPGKRAVCERVMMEKMVELIIVEKIKKRLICRHGTPKGEHCSDCKIGA